MPVREAFRKTNGISAKALLASGLAVTIGFCAIVMFVLWQDRDEEALKVKQAGTNIVATISSDIDRNLELYDLSLQAVVDGLKLPEISTMSPELRQLVLFDRAATAKYLGSIFVLDSNGDVTIDSRSLHPEPSNHAGRDYFEVQKYGLNGGLYLSRPWISPEGEGLIAISRRLTNADGSFKGAVVGTLRLAFFDQLFRQVHLGTGDSMTLVREDGTVVMREPFAISDIGRNVAASPTFQRAIRAGAGSFEEVASFDGVTRLYDYKHIGDYPLILSYGNSVNTIYADWNAKAWKLGALMFMLCGINAALILFLVRSLRRRSEAEYRLSIVAATDELTQLHNRRRLDQILDETWRRCMAEGSPAAFLMIDVDHFKDYNDRFGHQAGDEALKAVAQSVRTNLPSASAVAARYGGEEIAVLLPNTSTKGAYAVAEKIRSSILDLRADQQGRPDSTPTISVGVASMVPRYGLQPRDLIRLADVALYDAKRNGRDCVVKARGLVEVTAGFRAA